MGLLHRKNLLKTMQHIMVSKTSCTNHDQCHRSSPRPRPQLQAMLPLAPPVVPMSRLAPPTPSITSSRSFTPFLSIMFCGLVVSLSFICYLTCAKRCRRRQTNHRTHVDLFNEDLGPIMHINPVWMINTIGLDQSLIESIHVFKYKKDEKLIEGTDCSICLSEFEDDEHLRLLPKCSHAFHVPCIDTWLRSHKNCPLCRAPIINSMNDRTEHAIIESNLITHEESETGVDDPETLDHDNDHHVVEVENNEEIVKGEEVSKKQSTMPKREHNILKGSSSSSSSSISLKAMKSSSFGRSLRKASSSTSKYRPHNQSY